MSNALIRKLEVTGFLTDEDKAKLQQICWRNREVGAGQDLTREGDRPENVHVITTGIACRYKMLPGSERQIMAVLVPGDFCDLHVAILGEMDHSIATISPCQVVLIPRSVILELTEHHPRITRALLWAGLVDEGVLREWLVNLGQRPADKRLAHFFCELLVRLQTVGLADANSYEMPIRQRDLADIFGLTAVHVNRTLQELRGAGLIVLKSQQLTIPDVARLKAFCGFDPNYLHLVPRLNADRTTV